MKRTVQLFTLSLVLAGCATGNHDFGYQAPTQQPGFDFNDEHRLYTGKTVNFADGVDANEATVLARIYFESVYGKCGSLGSGQDKVENWFFPCFVGLFGEPKPGIIVSKRGCLVVCRGGPTVANPSMLNPKFVTRNTFSKNARSR